MSLKVPNGFRLTFPTSIRFPLQPIEHMAVQLRTTQVPLATRTVCRRVIDDAVGLYDRACVSGTPATQTSMSRALSDYRHRLKELRTNAVRAPSYDMSFTLHFLPEGPRDFLGIAYCEESQFIQAWLKQRYVSEFGYDGRTDSAPPLSDETWRKRGDIWRRAFMSISAPSERGFTVTIIPENFEVGGFDVAPVFHNGYLPRWQSRLHDVAVDVWMNELHRQQVLDITNLGKIWRLMSDCASATPPAGFVACRDKVLPYLVHTPTWEQLTQVPAPPRDPLIIPLPSSPDPENGDPANPPDNRATEDIEDP